MGKLKIILVLAPPSLFNEILEIKDSLSLKIDLINASDLKSLIELVSEYSPDLLLSFGTSVIVPRAILIKSNMLSINIHAATPDYPGRDPHHFAHYDGVPIYGATMHYMSERVDEGLIIKISTFDVKDTMLPNDLLKKANECGLELIKNLLIDFNDDKPIKTDKKLMWNGKKRTRKDFVNLCRIDQNISEVEFNRRLRSTYSRGYNNLFIEMYGQRFFIDNQEL